MIYYEAICKTGKVRKNNEDNYYLDGKYLPMIHGDLPLETGQTCKDSATFAVFDGMGGEERGEAASYLAAKTLDHGLSGIIKSETSVRILPGSVHYSDLPYLMNDRICDYIKEEKLRFCGSTLAMITFTDQVATFTNLGDSRIFLLRDRELIQTSKDHTIELFGRKKLTQCLGISKSEFIIAPFVNRTPIQKGDVFFLCSDGVTDMISHTRLEDLLKSGQGLEGIERMILDRGAVDNYTVILLSYRK